MKDILVPNYEHPEGLSAYVLGAKLDSGNIGEAIGHRLLQLGFTVLMDDGARSNHPNGDLTRAPGQNITPDTARRYGYEPTGEGGYVHYEAPAASEFLKADADALIVTLGKTYKTHFADTSPFEVEKIIKANLVLPLEAAHRYVAAAEQTDAAGPHVTDRRIRHIVFIGSYAHTHPFTNGTLYCAAKAGLNMAVRALGWELTDRGYRVHIIHPYHVPGTPMWEEVERGVMESKGWTKEQAGAYARKDLKMPAELTPAEIADIVRELLTVPAWQWTSGTPIELYGGSR